MARAPSTSPSPRRQHYECSNYALWSYRAMLGRPYPARCTWCNLDNPPEEHWTWAKDDRYADGGHWRCRENKRVRGRESLARMRKDPVRGEELRAYARQYAKDHRRWGRYKSYRHIDNKRYGGGTLTWEMADKLMSQPCTYCGLPVSEGLDRRDNTIGHTAENVVPCCLVCNGILGDVPEGVKDLLAEGLRMSREKGLLDSWLPPQHRK